MTKGIYSVFYDTYEIGFLFWKEKEFKSVEYVKKINNNVAFAKDSIGQEYIVLGKGIGFNLKIGNEIPKDMIDRIFKAESNNRGMGSLDVLQNIKPEIIEITTRVSSFAEEKLKISFDNAQYLILADHLAYAVKRIQEGIEYTPLSQWELKKLYPQEYEVAKESLDIITEEFGIELDSAEIGFITNHFVNANSEFSSMKDNLKMTKIIKRIINLVEYQFQTTLDESSFDYSKFVSHLRYFVLRKMNNHMFAENPIDEELINMFQMKYPEAFSMAEKIEEYLQVMEGWDLSSDEKLYLTVHIRRLTSEN
jgi:beta-glucoside operon transcriptional antiterminator